MQTHTDGWHEEYEMASKGSMLWMLTIAHRVIWEPPENCLSHGIVVKSEEIKSTSLS